MGGVSSAAVHARTISPFRSQAANNFLANAEFGPAAGVQARLSSGKPSDASHPPMTEGIGKAILRDC